MEPQLKSDRFEILRQLGSGGMGVVYEAYDHEIDAIVALKMLQTVNAERLYLFKQEFRGLADIQHPNLLRLGELLCEGGQWFFTMELVHGQNFLQFVRIDGPPHHPRAAPNGRGGAGGIAATATRTVQLTHRVDGARHLPVQLRADRTRGYDEPRLRLAACQLAAALHALHTSGHIHRDVKHSNVLVRDDGHLVLLDFGLLLDLAATEAGWRQRGRLQGTPLFMAPEQVQGEQVGPEADWYAFGVMLFDALTGTAPFTGSTQQILEAKCSLEAPAARSLLDEVPVDLDQLCRELLERDPFRRPQGAEILTRLGVDPGAAMIRARRSRDTGDVFIGRGRELEALNQALAECEAGRAVSLIVEGEPGVGKTALVRHFLATRDPSTVVLTGRCYEQEWVPFKGFDTIVDSLSLYLSSLEDEQALELTRGGVRFLVAVFPVLGRVPAIARKISGDRSVANPMVVREQAFQELKRLLFAISQAVPLVLFIDDLQWADKDSLALLETLLEPPDEPACLFIGTARVGAPDDADGAEPPSHVAALRELPRTFRQVTLSGLSTEESRQLWDRLSSRGPSNEGRGNELDSAVREAGGHPLFLSELARYASTIHNGEKLTGRSCHLMDVLWGRVERLDEPARSLMELVAVLGAPLDFRALARAAELDIRECLHLLSGLRSAQLVRMNRRGNARLIEPYHDRIREAIMQHITAACGPERLKRLHLQLGRGLLDTLDDRPLSAEVFTVVHQLNQASELIDHPAERLRLAQLNLLAGHEAKLATAYDAALEYVERGLSLMTDASWHADYSLYRDLHLERMEAEYLAGKRDQAVQRFSELLESLASDEEIARLYASRISLDSASARFAEAIESGREGLARFGVHLPARGTTTRVVLEHAALRWKQGRRAPHELAHLPQVTDPAIQSAMKVLIAVLPAMYLSDARLLAVTVIRAVRLLLEHGVSHEAAFAYAAYGLVLTGSLDQLDQGYAFGELGHRLDQRLGHDRNTAKVCAVHRGFLMPWVRPLPEAERQLREGLETATRIGDIGYEGYLGTLLGLSIYCQGVELAASQAKLEELAAISAQRRQDEMSGLVDALVRFCAALRGHNDDPLTLSRDGSSEASFHAWLVASLDDKNSASLYVYHLLKAELAYFFGQLALAETCLAASRKLVERIYGHTILVDATLMEVLLAAQRYPRASWLARRRLSRAMGKWHEKLRGWARACPQNFEPQWLLAGAEVARARGDRERACQLYEHAIAAARDYGAPKREALALELLARLCADRGDPAQARTHVLQAIDAYRRWGAEAKAKSLEQTWSAAAPQPQQVDGKAAAPPPPPQAATRAGHSS